MVLRDHTQHYQSIKVLGGIYSRLRLILDRRLTELDKLALKITQRTQGESVPLNYRSH